MEKIVQAAFEVPPVSAEDLREAFLAEANAVCAAKKGEDPVRVMNIILGLVTPLLKSPRDLKRLIGMLQVTWPAVGPEVDRADFIAMEALRLFRPPIYMAIRANAQQLTGAMVSSTNRQSNLASAYDDLLLKEVAEDERPAMRLALRRLFPRLDGVWANVHYSSDNTWRRQRLICSAEHFPTYFRFAIDSEILSSASISELVTKANDREFVQSTLRNALSEKLKSGRTRASVFLDELIVHAPEIAPDDIGPLVIALFEIADELDVQSDEGRGMFSFANNSLRLHRLLNALVRERLQQQERMPMLRVAMKSASLGWYCDFAECCHKEHKEEGNRNPMAEDQRFVDEKTAATFVKRALNRLRSAAKDCSIAHQRRLISLLYEWVRLSPRGLKEVRSRVNKLLVDDEFLIHFAQDACGVTWSHTGGFDGMGDLVAKKTIQLNKKAIRELANPAKFTMRIHELIARTIDPEALAFLRGFVQAWDKPEPTSW